MLHPLTRFFINVFYVASLLVLALSALLFLARAFLHEDGNHLLSNLINDNISGVQLMYDNVTINFSLQDIHFSVDGLDLTIGAHSLRSAQANFWLGDDKIKISLPNAEIYIADTISQDPKVTKITTKIALPLELSAINAQINIAAATLTLANSDLFLNADAENWLLNINQQQEQQNIHLRATGDYSQHIRVYSELHNITLSPLQFSSSPLNWSEVSATLIADIQEGIQYRAAATFNNLHSDVWQVTTTMSHWQSHGDWHSNDSMRISVVASAVSLNTPQTTIAHTHLAAIWQQQQERWHVEVAQLTLANHNNTATMVINSRGKFSTHCNGTLCLDDAGGDFFVNTHTSLPNTPLLTARSHVYWQQMQNKGWQLAMPDLRLTTADGGANMTVMIQSTPTVTLIAVDGRATAPIAITAIAQYVPTGALREWLGESLLGGTVQQAMFSLHSNSDFTPTQTTLQVTAIFDDGILAIADDWQTATELAGTFVYNDDSIIISGNGSFDHLPVASVHAHIPEIHNEPNTLFLDIVSNTAALTNYLHATKRIPPIREIITETMSTLQINGGRGILSLTLSIPLEQPENSTVRAHLALHHAAITVRQFPLYDNVNGDVYFDHDNIRGNMSGKINHKNAINAPPISVSFNNNTLTVSGTAETALLLSLANLTLAPLTGDATFTIIRTTKATMFSASLEDTEINLPYPLHKKSGEAAQIALHSTAANTAAGYQSADITLNLQINDNGMDLAINETSAPPVSGINLHGKIANVNLADWLNANNDNLVSDTPYHFSTMRLTLYNSHLLGVHNNEIRAHGMRVSEGKFSLTLNSDSINGNLLADADSLVGRFSHLHLSHNNISPAIEDPHNDDFTSLRIDLTAATLIVASLTLGAMRVAGAPQTDNSWLFSTIEISNPDITLIAGGSYEDKHTFLTLHLQVNEIPTLLTILHIPPIIENGRSSVLGNIAWHGSPLNFNLSEMKGKLLITAEEVQYADVDISTEVVNFLALFSPSSLFSRDFSELGKSGILFQSIQGDIILDSGKAQLTPFNLESHDAKMNLQGEIDYINQQYDLYGEVFPGKTLLKAGSTIGLGTGLILLNPASFVAGSILGKVFEEPIAAIGRYDYTISGSWEDPIYERNKKEE
ncbi:MAG: hypothetical protein K0U15_05115 [Proteobacteria bacterium]|nr:hypothetical protein [Pseudomonadota bacterium]